MMIRIIIGLVDKVNEWKIKYDLGYLNYSLIYLKKIDNFGIIIYNYIILKRNSCLF